jgi:UDP-glucose 4-epimerase
MNLFYKKNIFMTGGAGYIGSHIVEKLVNKNNIIILDNLRTGHKKLINKKAVFIKGDIKNRKLLSKIIEKYNIQTIIHLAAFLNVNEAERNKLKYYKNNIDGTKNIILACKNTGVKNIIFSSSCSIYGDIEGSVSERKKPNPQGYYAYTKFKGEELIRQYAKRYKYSYGILRYFNVAGASCSGKIGEIEASHGHLIKNMAIQSLKKNPVIKIFGNNYPTKDGTCIRDYIHVSDLADIHIKAIEYLEDNKKSFILNCGYGKGYSVKEMLTIFKKLKKNLNICYQKRRPGDIAQVYSNTKKLNQLLKWKPKYNNINKIIKSAINWEKKLKRQY